MNSWSYLEKTLSVPREPRINIVAKRYRGQDGTDGVMVFIGHSSPVCGPDLATALRNAAAFLERNPGYNPFRKAP